MAGLPLGQDAQALDPTVGEILVTSEGVEDGRQHIWEGFPGHPLRKDFLALPGGFKPGLQRFPFEFPSGEREYPYLGRTPPGVPAESEPAAESEAPVDGPGEGPKL